MKKAVVFFIFGVVLFGVCSAQNANAQNANIAQKIIGTWTEQNGTTWVFNASGTVTIGSESGKFAVADTKLAIYINRRTGIYDISLSSDGKTLILTFGGDATNGVWLTI